MANIRHERHPALSIFQATLVARLGSTQFGLTQWQVYPFGYRSR